MSYQITARDMLVSELTHRGESTIHGGAQQISIRLQAEHFTMVQAMAEESSVARNHIINQLLAVGIEEVWQELPKDAQQRIADRRSEMLYSMAKGEKFERYSVTKGKESTQ